MKRHSVCDRPHLLGCFILLSLAGCHSQPKPSDADLMSEIARAIDRNQIPRAKLLLDNLLQQHPRHPKALVFRAQFAWDEGDAEHALELLKLVEDDPPQISGTARYLEGDIYFARGDAITAEARWRESIRLHPAFPKSRERLAKLYILQYRGAEAEALIWSLRRLRSWSLTEHVMWQLARSGAGQAKDAGEILERFVQQNPSDLISCAALARYRILENKFPQAIDLLRDHHAADLMHGGLLGLWAWANWLNGNQAEVTSQLPEEWPDSDADVWLWRIYGRMAQEGADWPGAAWCWWNVCRGAPDDREAAYNLGLALEHCGFSDAPRQQLADARHLEEMITHVQHLLEGEQQRKDLAAVLVHRIVEELTALDRPEQASVWLQLLATWQPNDPRIGEQFAALQQRNATAKRAIGFDRLKERLLAIRPQTPKFSKPIGRSSPSAQPTENAISPIRFDDVGSAAGLDFQHYNGPTEFKYLLESLGGAVAVIDFDGDHWPDLYFPQGCRIPYRADDHEYLDQLYRNRGDGRFENVTTPAAVVENRFSQGVAAGDFNNDGFCDVFVANFGENVLWQNNGDGTFTDVSATAGLIGDDWSSSAAWSDLDDDGDLDLYVVKYVQDPFKICRNPGGEIAACSPGNFDGADDQLYLNLGDGTFAERLELAGLSAPNGKGLGVVIADLDNDQRPDIYVANDGTPNFLFQHQGKSADNSPRFLEIGLASGAALSVDGRAQAGMGIACADLNGDGRLDLYVTNFFNDYNTLYLNHGNMFFEDSTRSAGLVEPALPMLGFGTQAIDADLDRWPDLIVANGHIDNHSDEGIPWKMPAQFFRNMGQAAFEDVSLNAGAYFQEPVLGRAVARLDFDRDGRPDAVIVHQDRHVALLENRSAVSHPAVSLRLVGTVSNRDAIGTRITASFPDGSFIHQLNGGDGYFATNDRNVLIGTGNFSTVTKIAIQWPSGKIIELDEVRAGESLLVLESGERHSQPVR